MEEIVTQKTAPTAQAGAKAIQTGQRLAKGIKDGVPIALGYFPVSFTFGILATSYGFSWWEATLISMLNLTSAGQFAGLNIMHAGGGLIEMALSQLVINLRYSLMSISLSQKVDQTVRGFYRWALAFGNTDEIFAVAVTQKQPVTKRYFLGLTTLPYIGWTTGTAIGALLGDVLPVFIVNALGIGLYAMFIAIIIPAGMQNKKIIPVMLVSVAVSCLFTFIPFLQPVKESGFVDVIAALVAAVFGALVFPIKEEKEETSDDTGGDV